MNQKKPKSYQAASNAGPPQPPQIHRIESNHSNSSKNTDVTSAQMLPSTKTQAQPTPMPSLSPVLAHSPAQSAGASPQPTSVKIMQSQSSMLAQNSGWLTQASERIEKTIELINMKKIKDALQILLEINQVFESSGVCVSTTGGIDSTKSTSPIPGSKPPDLSARRNKISVQLAIITKYNLACCFQSLGESKECIKYLQQASRQLSYYSNMDTPQGLFKVNLNDKASTTKKGGGVITPADNSVQDSNDFNEYNCIGASSGKGGGDNESADLQKQTHDQLSAQLQANRYLCKFHLQLCAIMSQLGQHVQANENGQQAAAIAEVILIKTHEFCQMSVDNLFQRDNKFKSIVDQATENIESTSRGDYHGGSLKSSMANATNQKSQRKLTRGSSVTSLYSQEKERKSVSIRRSRSKANTMRGRDSSLAATSDETTQSLERMYTFNLSRVQKPQNGPKGKGAKKEGPNVSGVPAGEDAIDIQPVDAKNKQDKGKEPASINIENQNTNAKVQNPEEENKQGPGSQFERTGSQASRSIPRTSVNSFCPTYQVLERTNIQEKQILNVQPLLDEFRRVSEQFNQESLTLAEAETHAMRAQFLNLKEIHTLKANKRYKINVRNTLGVKDHNNWIYNLNIGNVMNLTPMNSDELNTQSDVFQELSKDTMLEKIILYVVAYFCVGTEIRFQATKMEKKESPQEYIKVWSSEMWHGKSLQVACLFLPEDCPLVDHIIKSYKKHYIGKQSLLSVVVQPKPRNKPPSQPVRSQPSTSEGARPSNIQKISDRPASQQTVSKANNELSSEKRRIQQKSPLNGELSLATANSKIMGKEGGRISQPQPPVGGQSQPNNLNDHFSLQNRLSLQNGVEKMAWGKFNFKAEDEGMAGQQPQKLPHTGAQNSLTNAQKQNVGNVQNLGAVKAQNSKMRQKTLKDMVFQNLKPQTAVIDNPNGNNNANFNDGVGGAISNAPNKQHNNAATNQNGNLMQYNKVPPKSPETPEGCTEEKGENQEAIVIFSNRVARQRKLSRNKQTASATIIGQDGQEEGVTGQDSKEDDSQEKSKVNESNQSPSVRRRAVQPMAAQQRAASPRPEVQAQMQVGVINQDQKTEPVKRSRPYAQTITYSEIQRLQNNLNNQIQHNKKKQAAAAAFKQAQPGKDSSLPDSQNNNFHSVGDRPQSAQHTTSSNAGGVADSSAQPVVTSGSYQKRIENKPSTSGNNNSGGTPKRSSQVNQSHKRYQHQPSITSSLQKLVSKPGAKGQSKVLQSEALNPQAWPTVASSASSKQGKQKIIMLQKQKKQLMNGQGAGQAQSALWLATNNPASDKLQSKHPIQIGTTKFVDNQLKMLQASSNTSTARGNKKQGMGMSPKHQNEAAKKDNIIDNLRKKPIGDLQRAYDTASGVGTSSAAVQNLNGLSKSIAKEKFHQSNLIPHQPMPGQQKLQVHHHFNNKLASGQPGFGPGAGAAAAASQHTLKKSASTRQVVNLLDFQSMQQPNVFPGSSKGAAMNHGAGQSILGKHVGGAQGSLVASHHLGAHGKAGGPTMASSVLTASASKQGAGSGVATNFKTLSKKHKNTKSTGLLHHHM